MKTLLESIKALKENANEDMNVGTINSDSGFYIGDPCYVLDDSIYYGIWDKKYDFQDGLIETEQGNFLVHGTKYGDGCYRCGSGECGVDSGTIAVIPRSLVSKEDGLRLGVEVDGDSASLEYQSEAGIFCISISNPDNYFEIVTGEYPEDEEDYYDDEY